MSCFEKTVFQIQATAAKRKFVSFERNLFGWLIASGDSIKELGNRFIFIPVVDNLFDLLPFCFV